MLAMAEEFSAAQQFLQVIVTLLGILSQILLLVKGVKEQPNETTVAGDRTTTLRGSIAQRLQGKRNILDLSFVLVGAAFFSLLITDSLVISGRTPSPKISTILIVLIITLVIVGAMVCAWVLNQTELVTGFLAITTLFILVISPGGPFFSSSSTNDSETGLSLLVPITVLVILASTMLIYSFGNPLSRTLPRNKRAIVTLILVCITAASAGALGRQLISDVVSDPRTPRLDTKEVKDLLPAIMNADVKDRRLFYRLASEVALSLTYQNYFRTVRGERLQTDQPTMEPSPTILSDNKKLGPSESANNNGKSTAQPTATPTPKNSSEDSPLALVETKALEILIQRAEQDRDYESATHFKSFARRSQSVAESFLSEQERSQGRARPNLLINYFKSMDIAEQQQYLVQRLEWIFPTGLPEQSQASIPLPGLTNEERFEAISSLRIIQVLNDQENLRNKLFKEFDKEFDYPRAVRAAFEQRSSDSAEDYLDFSSPYNANTTNTGSRRYGKARNIRMPLLFPKLEPDPNNTRLIEQLGLPFEVEIYTAYNEYKQLALSLIKRDFRGKIADADAEQLTETFNQLDDQTQEAFLFYVVHSKDASQLILQMLVDLKEIDFTPLTDSEDPLVVDELKSVIDRSSTPIRNPQLVQIVDNVSRISNAESKRIFKELINRDDPKISVKFLFDPRVFALVDRINKTLSDQRKDFFDGVADPIWSVVKDVAKTSTARGDSKLQLTDLLEKFRKLSPAEQEGLLHSIAISLHQPGGRYSLDPVRLLVSQSKSYNNIAALASASTITLPLLLVCIVMGGYFSRKLLARDRMRELVAKETSGSSEDERTFGSPVELHGREDILRSLRQLAERGWSTIGIVGRRGIGKSRLLYSLSQTSPDETDTPSIKVWVSSPSKFQEEDFISSMLERLASNTESAIASYLNVKPLSIRRIEGRAALVGFMLYACALTILGLIIYAMASRLTRPDIIVTWLPILGIIFTSIGLFISYLSKVQPVNLSSWLQRDRMHSPYTVMLYREVHQVLIYLRRRTGGGLHNAIFAMGVLRLIVVAALGLLCLYMSYAALSDLIQYGSRVSIAFPALIAALSGCASVYLYLTGHVNNIQSGVPSHNLMSLVAEYREFASTVVHRLKQGALGHPTGRRFSVLICVDELDKIVDFDDLRAFVRRIKAIFEVPGVYYYVSLAEDALAALYLGPAEGKNEIDSSFDHIVRIDPLSCSAGETIASKYLTSHGLFEPHPRMARMIATLSYGVPRDIIRRCDEVLARRHTLTHPSQLALDIRKTQANMGYELLQLSREKADRLMLNAWDSANVAADIIKDSPPDDKSLRLLLSIWLISLAEMAVNFSNEGDWKEISNKLCVAGYTLPIEPLSDLRDNMFLLHEDISRISKDNLPPNGVVVSSVNRHTPQ